MKANGTILVVDDLAENRIALSYMLKKEGYEVAEAGNGNEALKQLETLKPELILLDLKMPVMDGWTFMAIKKQTPAIASIPVIVLSGEEGPSIISSVKGRRLQSAKFLTSSRFDKQRMPWRTFQ